MVLRNESVPFLNSGQADELGQAREYAVNLAATKIIGRPRDETRDAAILEATIAVLSDVGYDRLTIDAVATKAKASKATVYRRWQNKAGLVVDALATLKHKPA